MSERDEEYAQRFAERVREGLRARGHRIGTVLTGLPVPACEEGLDLVREIVAAMASRFGISDEEAVLRVTHYFKDWDLTDDSDTGDLLYIGHQTPVEWAGSIYLGLDFHEVQPDADLSGHEPRPLPQWPGLRSARAAAGTGLHRPLRVGAFATRTAYAAPKGPRVRSTVAGRCSSRT
jgi:hypothetical protein